MGYTFVWAGELRVFLMAACANALKIAEQHIRGSRRMLLWAMLTAILVSAIGSVWMQVALGYSYGAINLSGFFRGLVHYPFNFTARNLLNPTGPVWQGWVWTAYGGGLMGFSVTVGGLTIPGSVVVGAAHPASRTASAGRIKFR